MENYGLHVKIPKQSGIERDTPLTAMAFFLGANQAWASPNWSKSQISRFKKDLEECDNLDGSNIVVHGCYLMNPASDREDVREKTLTRFLEEVKLCEQLGVERYVFHPGSTRGDIEEGLDTVIDLIKSGLQHSKKLNILVENMTKTNSLGQTWEELSYITRHIGSERVGVCLDTAHCWGAGSNKGMHFDSLLDDFNRIIGIEKLQAIHLNDSKVAYGSNLDRHEDLLKGQIPKKFWKRFIFDARVKNIPTILETPSNCHNILKKLLQEKEDKKEDILDKDEIISD